MTYSPDLRDELKSRLQLLCDEKLLLGNPERVRQLASEAVEISRRVGAPWEQLAAYRLAHVLLREPSVDEDHAEETARLKRIAEHFQLAADYEQERLFGPLPHIYLIAVWNRLKQHDQHNAANYQQEIENHFETASRLIQINTQDATKIALWNTFASGHRFPQCSVPLFHIRNGGVTIIPYGRDNHLVLKRAQQMETKMRV